MKITSKAPILHWISILICFFDCRLLGATSIPDLSWSSHPPKWLMTSAISIRLVICQHGSFKFSTTPPPNWSERKSIDLLILVVSCAMRHYLPLSCFFPSLLSSFPCMIPMRGCDFVAPDHVPDPFHHIFSSMFLGDKFGSLGYRAETRSMTEHWISLLLRCHAVWCIAQW